LEIRAMLGELAPLAPTPIYRRRSRQTEQTMAFVEMAAKLQADIWILAGDSARPFLNSPSNEYQAVCHPTGNACVHIRQDRQAEEYVQPFPVGEGRCGIGRWEAARHLAPERVGTLLPERHVIYSTTITEATSPGFSEHEPHSRFKGCSPEMK
jgi:hypothetical protein